MLEKGQAPSVKRLSVIMCVCSQCYLSVLFNLLLVCVCEDVNECVCVDLSCQIEEGGVLGKERDRILARF